ncbi:MAG: orotate phosphoribosyltransferase [Bacteroidetes bacterium HGW-Bacteroidetes-21]|jgi:orotate phosphoribosyltransferase|nr:MAG: orotate phosphoribosyltransferase [Bacteroidetes bacterium HGW-Bacteroidetes-21]
MENVIENKVAEYLLQIKAIKLQPANPFTWASGWISPIYCDNRKTLSYHEVRTYIRDSFVEVIRKNYPDVELIAGVATGAIAHGALVAEAMGLPFVYIRAEAKKHGLENLVEGEVKPGQKAVVIEDLISTGGSSLKAFNALKESGAVVLGMAAIFSYQFPVAQKNFDEAGCKLVTLSNYHALTNFALQTGYIDATHTETLAKWRTSPDTWGK